MKQQARFRRLEIERLENRLGSLRTAENALRTPPTGGWVRAMRNALGMSVAQLAKRLNITRAAVYNLEKREVGRNVTLQQLDRAAAALGCEVQYALVPKKPLEQIIRDQARAKAEEYLQASNASMRLEAVGVQGPHFQTAVSSASSLTEALTDRMLWDK